MPHFEPVMLRRLLMREMEVLVRLRYGGQLDSNVLHKQEGTTALYFM